MSQDVPQALLTPAAGRESWRRSRPAYHPEDGSADRSDWLSLLKAAILLLVPVAMLALLLTR